MNQKDVNNIFVFIANKKQENPREQISINEVEKECNMEHFDALDILEHLKSLRKIDFVAGIGGIAMDIHPTAEGWEYLWEKKDIIKRLLNGTKFEKLYETLLITKEKIRGD